jgi:hypothetical protein
MKKDFIQTFETVEDMLPAVKDLIINYCIDNEVDEKNIHPTLWNDILDEIKIHIVKPNNRLLKTDTNRYNQYDKDKVYILYNYIYKKICNKYIQEISLQGFINMSGIEKQSFYNWVEGPSAKSLDLHEKIMQDNEQSLTSLMIGDKGIPTKYLAKLNRYHGWNMPGVTRETSKRQSLGAAELPKLGIHNTENAILPSDCTIDAET